MVAASGITGPSAFFGFVRERWHRDVESFRFVRADGGVATGAGDDGDARSGVASAHGHGLRGLQQFVGIVDPHRARLADQCFQYARVAGDRAGVCCGSGRTERTSSGLEHHDADVTLRALGECIGELLSVAFGFEVERDGANTILMSQRMDVVGGIQHGLVAARHDGVEAQRTPACRSR